VQRVQRNPDALLGSVLEAVGTVEEERCAVLQLNGAITTLAWTQVSLILLVIIATVIVSEWVSAKVRHAII
jgi:hypothetical protein